MYCVFQSLHMIPVFFFTNLYFLPWYCYGLRFRLGLAREEIDSYAFVKNDRKQLV